MACYTPNHHLSGSIHEQVLNHIVDKFYHERPHLFRRVSKGIEPTILGDPNPQEPIRVGETGHLIDFDVSLRRPASPRRFINLHPVSSQENPYSLSIPSGQFLVDFEIGLLFRHIALGVEWKLALDIGFLGELVAPSNSNPDHIKIGVIQVDLLRMAPPELEKTVEYIAQKTIDSALGNLKIPVNFFVSDPVRLKITIKDLEVDSDRATVRADTDLV